jgi:hypothetical protein
MNANREYKDSVFTLLFHHPASLLELYNAINGTNYTNVDDVKINTLQNALFMDRVNDLSFTIGDTLVVLVEHQSTLNPNIALRLLIYMSKLYERMVDGKLIYSRKQMSIPHPPNSSCCTTARRRCPRKAR